MFEIDEDSAQITFQWVVGDLRALEKNLSEASQPKHYHAIIIVGRLIAYAVTFAVAYALLPDANFHVILWIAAAGTLSIWVALGFEVAAGRLLERMTADDPRRVGWNSIWLDRSGVTFATETTEDYASWLGVSSVVERDGSIWIKTGPVHGFYIPARVFDSDEERAECLSLIAELRQKPLPPRHLADAETDLIRH